jgi:hypothetical protein
MLVEGSELLDRNLWFVPRADQHGDLRRATGTDQG